MYVESLIQHLYDMIAEGEIEKSGEVKLDLYGCGSEYTEDFSYIRLSGVGGNLHINVTDN